MKAPEKPTAGRKTRGAVAVVEALREDILTLALRPGAAIDELSLAERFGVSRTPVREALLVLASEGLVSFLQNRTSIVSPHSMENANDYLDTLSILSRAVFRQAAERREDSDLKQIDEDLQGLKHAAVEMNVDTIEAAELVLQRDCCRSTRNFFYQRYYPSCLNSGRRMLRLHYYPFATRADFEETLSEYTTLQQQLRARDAEACDAAILRIINQKIDVMQRSIRPSAAATMKLGPSLRSRMDTLSR
jgi:DNA-binding GntR family transcriptional regulator